jgi:uncharacterized BrkB/YihY/UPF0761 family membrane protein
VPGARFVDEMLDRERRAAASLLAGGLAYRLFFWLVPLGLVFAATLGFWVADAGGDLEDTARDFGITGVAASAAMSAIESEAHKRWYLLVSGAVLVVWFSIGVVRALCVTHNVAWGLGPRKLRRPLRAGLGFTGLALAALAFTVAAGWAREAHEGPGLILTLLLVAAYLGGILWLTAKLPHRAASWKELLPGAVLVAVGMQAMHLVVALYIAPKLARSSELYGALGGATTILLWLYLTARLWVAGTFLNAAVWQRRHGEGGAGQRLV